MRATTLLALWLLAGCQSTSPSGAIFQPVTPAPAAPAPAGVPSGTAAPAPEEGGFDFDADARKQEEGTGTEGAPLEPGQVASALGLGGTQAAPTPVESPPEVTPAPAQGSATPPAAPTPAVPPAPPAWTPASPLEGSWGVRLVSTVPEAQPPRAILGMADGSEVVVQPGTLLPDAHLAVLAVGRDAVQLAEFIPNGDHVRVETHVLQPMYGTTKPQR